MSFDKKMIFFLCILKKTCTFAPTITQLFFNFNLMLMKKLFLSLFALLCLGSTTPIFADATRIFCKMEYSWWTQDNARIGIILDNGDPTAMTIVDGTSDTWFAEVDLSEKTSVTFRRIGPSNTDNWGAETTAQNISDNNVGTSNNFFTITNSEAAWSGSSQYCTGTWNTYTFVAPVIKLKGGFNSWGDADVFADNSGLTATITKNIAEGSYGMKILVGNDWRSNYTTITRTNSGNEYDFSGNPTDATLEADIDGDYTFTYNYFTKKLSVSYPALPEQHVDFDGLAATILKGTAVNFAATSSGITNPGYIFYVKPEGGEYGSAVSSYNFNTIGNFVVKVEALENNTGEPVATKEANVTVYETYTFTNGTKIYVDFSAMTEGATGVNYPFGDQSGNLDYDADGAGKTKTITFTQNVEWSTLQNFVNTEKNGWNGLKFSAPAAGQNCAVVAADGASYTWTTRMPTIALHSNFTNPSWEGSADFAVAGNKETASLALTISQGESYEFGVMVDGEWRANGSAFDRFNNSKVIPAGNTTNCMFVADATGQYTFTWTYATNTLSVEYPAALSVALSGLNASQFVGNEVTIGATTNLTNASYAYQLKIDDGEFAALSENPYTFAAAGTYTFKVIATGAEGVVEATKEVAVYEPLTLYFANKEGWTDLHAYAYNADNADIKNANWPGETMTATGETTANNGYNVYSVTIAKGRYTTIIFNGNEGGSQTANLVIDESLPYYCGGTWYATLAECDPAAQTYHLYVRNLTTWDKFDVYAWGDNNYLGGWPGKAAVDNTTTIDGVTYNVYDFDAVENATISMHIIFNNEVTEAADPNYKRHEYQEVTEARDYYFTVTNDAAWEGLAGVKRFRPYIPMEHVYGYQYDVNGTVGTEWPGAELYPNEQGWYEFIVNKGRTVIFNNGTGEGAMQTGDLAYTDDDPVADECAVWLGETSTYGDKTYMTTSNDCNAAVALKYERGVTNGNYGTICLPYSAIKVEGAELFSIAGKDENGIYLDEASELLKGVPYIFLANADQLTVYYWGGQSFTPSADHLYTTNGLVGFINDGQDYTVAKNAHNYILHDNGLYLVDSTVKIKSNRAFIDWANVPSNMAPSSAPRRNIGINKIPTGIEEITSDKSQMTNKFLRDGQLVIIKNGVTYNAQGQIVK